MRNAAKHIFSIALLMLVILFGVLSTDTRSNDSPGINNLSENAKTSDHSNENKKKIKVNKKEEKRLQKLSKKGIETEDSLAFIDEKTETIQVNAGGSSIFYDMNGNFIKEFNGDVDNGILIYAISKDKKHYIKRIIHDLDRNRDEYSYMYGDENSDKLWEVNLPLTDPVISPNGDIIAFIGYYDMDEYSTSIYDVKGNVMKKFPLSLDLKFTSNGKNILASGGVAKNCDEDIVNGFCTSILYFDKKGNLLWKRNMEEFAGIGFQFANFLLGNNDTQIVVATKIANEVGDLIYSTHAIDHEGNFQWTLSGIGENISMSNNGKYIITLDGSQLNVIEANSGQTNWQLDLALVCSPQYIRFGNSQFISISSNGKTGVVNTLCSSQTNRLSEYNNKLLFIENGKIVFQEEIPDIYDGYVDGLPYYKVPELEGHFLSESEFIVLKTSGYITKYELEIFE